ncbi:DNA glycosylase AlkZ-like family protein [uncultured Cellulomonas sp.]|uniref:winged helix-turn-helix domain-containing protein n=1 Tax=uncultured Cellulomonas sp. TaxID=189682 RepID=UPI0028E97200|nr:crosslink repair DNA glycosylase YcaQ family protein [uncultured Cellulomonas sp.]
MIPAGAAPERLSLSQARRIALRAQGLDRPRPQRATPATMRQFQQVVDRLGVLQIDSVNVLARAHLMPAFSRIGAYDPALLDRAAGQAPRRLVETWAHMASFVPPETYRLLGWRQRAYQREAWGTIAQVPLTHSPVVDEVRAIITERGPVTARQVQEGFEAEHPTTREEWGWNWTVAKQVLEFLFFTGEVTSAGRNGAFERRYDLTSRVLPADVLAAPEPSDQDAVRALVEISARAHGIGTLRCFADYFRIKLDRVSPAVADLVEDGVLQEVTVDGWNQGRVWRHRDADLPRRASGTALLNPFDPLVFERRRVEALFGLRYRIEIYVPEPKRVWGYYVLPFLLGESLSALVDLKADRQAGVLRVHAAHRSTGPDTPVASRTADLVEPLAGELRTLAGWLGLDEIVVGDRTGLLRGDLAVDLAQAVRAA